MLTRIVHCQKDRYDVYIGRSMPRYRLTQSIFHNPFRIGPDGDRNEVLAKYRVHATKLIDTNPLFKKGVMNLRGRTMGCWCCKTPVTTIRPPDEQICHGEILAELSENLFESGTTCI